MVSNPYKVISKFFLWKGSFCTNIWKENYQCYRKEYKVLIIKYNLITRDSNKKINYTVSIQKNRLMLAICFQRFTYKLQ